MAKTVFITFEQDESMPEVDAVQIGDVVFTRGKPTQINAGGLDTFLGQAPNARFSKQEPTEELKAVAKQEADEHEREQELNETQITDVGADVPKDTASKSAASQKTTVKAEK